MDHKSETFCTSLHSSLTNGQYLLKVSICQEYILQEKLFTAILTQKWSHYHHVLEGWSESPGHQTTHLGLQHQKIMENAKPCWSVLGPQLFMSPACLSSKSLTRQRSWNHLSQLLVSLPDSSTVHELASRNCPHSQHRGRCKDIFKVGNNFTHYPNVQKQNA